MHIYTHSWMYTSEFINFTSGPVVFTDSYIGLTNKFKIFETMKILCYVLLLKQTELHAVSIEWCLRNRFML